MGHDRAVIDISECSSLFEYSFRVYKGSNVTGVAQVGVTLFFRYEDFKFS